MHEKDEGKVQRDLQGHFKIKAEANSIKVKLRSYIYNLCCKNIFLHTLKQFLSIFALQQINKKHIATKTHIKNATSCAKCSPVTAAAAAQKKNIFSRWNI